MAIGIADWKKSRLQSLLGVAPLASVSASGGCEMGAVCDRHSKENVIPAAPTTLALGWWEFKDSLSDIGNLKLV